MNRRSIDRFLLIVGVLLPCAPATAHDFWIEPGRFRVAPGETVSLRFLIGEPGAVEHWSTEWRKVVSLQDFGPNSVTDRLGAIRPLDGSAPAMDRIDAAFPLSGPGTHIIAFTSNHAASDLPAAEFNSYAEHEGLGAVLAKRAREGKAGENGRELYSRRAKALIQVGAHVTDTVSQPIGQTLEIVPDKNPYLIRPGEPLRARIWFHGAPLAGAAVVLEKLGAGATPGKPVISDEDGWVSFAYAGTGAWKLHTIWSYSIEDPRADYETIFSSLSFGFE